MFKWLKGREVPPPAERHSAARPPAKAAAPMPVAPAAPETSAGPAPLPEVVGEGSTEADWSAWEDSMTALDSQMQGLLPSDRVYVRETRPSQLDELDPFSAERTKAKR